MEISCLVEETNGDINPAHDFAKDGDHGWFDLHVAFTMILCDANFCIW